MCKMRSRYEEDNKCCLSLAQVFFFWETARYWRTRRLITEIRWRDKCSDEINRQTGLRVFIHFAPLASPPPSLPAALCSTWRSNLAAETQIGTGSTVARVACKTPCGQPGIRRDVRVCCSRRDCQKHNYYMKATPARYFLRDPPHYCHGYDDFLLYIHWMCGLTTIIMMMVASLLIYMLII